MDVIRMVLEARELFYLNRKEEAKELIKGYEARTEDEAVLIEYLSMVAEGRKAWELLEFWQGRDRYLDGPGYDDDRVLTAIKCEVSRVVYTHAVVSGEDLKALKNRARHFFLRARDEEDPLFSLYMMDTAAYLRHKTEEDEIYISILLEMIKRLAIHDEALPSGVFTLSFAEELIRLLTVLGRVDMEEIIFRNVYRRTTGVLAEEPGMDRVVETIYKRVLRGADSEKKLDILDRGLSLIRSSFCTIYWGERVFHAVENDLVDEDILKICDFYGKLSCALKSEYYLYPHLLYMDVLECLEEYDKAEDFLAGISQDEAVPYPIRLFFKAALARLNSDAEMEAEAVKEAIVFFNEHSDVISRYIMTKFSDSST